MSLKSLRLHWHAGNSCKYFRHSTLTQVVFNDIICNENCCIKLEIDTFSWVLSDFWTTLYVCLCPYILIFHIIYLYAPPDTTKQMCLFLKNIQSNSNDALLPPSIFYLNSALQLTPHLCYGVSVCLDRMINYLSIWFLFWEIGSCAGWTCSRRNWFKWLTETPGVENSILIKKAGVAKN